MDGPGLQMLEKEVSCVYIIYYDLVTVKCQENQEIQIWA